MPGSALCLFIVHLRSPCHTVQMLMGEEPSPAADIYSFGVVLWEICCQEMPQRGRRRDPTPAEAPLVRNRPAMWPRPDTLCTSTVLRWAGDRPHHITHVPTAPTLKFHPAGGGGDHPDVPALQAGAAAQRQGGAGAAGAGGRAGGAAPGWARTPRGQRRHLLLLICLEYGRFRSIRSCGCIDTMQVRH